MFTKKPAADILLQTLLLVKEICEGIR